MNHDFFETAIVSLFLGCACLAAEQADSSLPTEFKAPPGKYITSWVGNSFPGDGGENGFGYWVQNGADEIEVTPDGTVIAGTDWDEAGRCVGLYKDGKPNRVLLKQEGPGVKETAWGWNTGNHAIAVEGTNIFVANTGKNLLRFQWTPGDLDSAKVVESRQMSDCALGLHARNGILAVAYTNQVELLRWKDGTVLTNFAVPDIKDLTLAPDGSLWVIAGSQIKHLSTNGVPMEPALLKGAEKPVSLSFDNRGRLIVCDDGVDQQVKFFDISGQQPRLAGTFGDKGGIYTNIEGLTSPTRFYAPRGAGTDAAGNLYVALGFNGAPVGTLVLRSFTPEGKLRWELANHAFVDTYGFDPKEDGKVIYGRTAVFDYNPQAQPSELPWKQRATILNHLKHPEDNMLRYAATVYIRHLQGRRLLYSIGQYGGGYGLYTFDSPQNYTVSFAKKITAPGETWAWWVSSNGDIWHGDAQDKMIHCYAFLGWGEKGEPLFETEKPESWPIPSDFDFIRRIMYDEALDVAYISGYLKDKDSYDSWGVCGPTLCRIDGWKKGKQTRRWTIKMPMNLHGNDEGKPLSPQSLSFAGEYLFVGMCKPDDGKQYIHIYERDKGTYVGSLMPGEEVGGSSRAGWLDMPYAIDAIKRKNGEYFILAEEDWRGKNLLYRWIPE